MNGIDTSTPYATKAEEEKRKVKYNKQYKTCKQTENYSSIREIIDPEKASRYSCTR